MRLDFVESRWQDRPPDCRLANQITHQEQKREHKLMLVLGPNKCFVWKDLVLTFLRQVLPWSGQLFPQLWIAARHWKSFMKRDQTWRIGRSSKKWSAMNFRASAWSNRNLVTWRKIFNCIPSIWVKKKELIWGNMFQRNVAATNSGSQVSSIVRKWAWDMLKRRS